jgi:hypothetical protein
MLGLPLDVAARRRDKFLCGVPTAASWLDRRFL